MTKQDLIEQRKKIQEDISCILDGIDNEILDQVHQVIVDRFEILLDQLNSD
jgi:hypothetical protein